MRVFLFFFFFTSAVLSQQTLEKRRDFVIINGCDNVDSIRKCFQEKIASIIINNLKKKDKKTIINSSKDSILNAYCFFQIERNGEINIEKSFINFENLNSTNKYKYLLKKIPKLKPKLDSFDTATSYTTSIFIPFLIDVSQSNISFFENQKKNLVALNFIQKAPIYDGCSREIDNKKLLQCATRRINKIISSNLNTDIFENHYIKNKKIKILTSFNVNRYGEIKNINTHSNIPEIKAEIERVFKLIPNFNEPAISNFSAVSVNLSLPINITLH